jgi:hypothetical protein
MKTVQAASKTAKGAAGKDEWRSPNDESMTKRQWRMKGETG